MVLRTVWSRWATGSGKSVRCDVVLMDRERLRGVEMQMGSIFPKWRLYSALWEWQCVVPEGRVARRGVCMHVCRSES